MPLQKFLLNPGINREGTAYTAEGGWFDGNLVRFRKGFPEKIGGWEKDTSNTYLGTGRLLHAWVTVSGTKLLGLGTRYKLYVQEGDVFYDVTPIRATTSAGDVTFSASNGSSTITATDTAHGASEGDFVTFSGAASLGGTVLAAVLNQEYQIASVPTANTFTFTAKDTSGDTVTANSSDSGNGGSSVVGAYQISSGLDVYVSSTGWSSDTWGAGTWGSSSSLTDKNQLRLWSLDNFGEDLIATVLNGGTYQWDKSNGTSTRAVSLGATAPVASRFNLVSADTRHLFLFGTSTTVTDAATQDDLFFRFADRESLTTWAPTATNEAGSLRIADGSRIVGAVRSTGQILVWTDTSLHGIQFVGTPFTFGQRQLGANCGLIAQHAAIDVNGRAYWMGDDAFYMYDGVVKKMPCSVQDYVYDDISFTNKNDIACGVNPEFNEVLWFYPSSSATQIDRVVVYNYLENTWYTSTLGRTTYLGNYTYEFPISSEYDTTVTANATTSTGVSNTPIGVTAGASYVYEQEKGNNQANGTAIAASLTTGSIEIGDGDQFMSVSKFVPDFTSLSKELTITLTLEDYPQSTTSQTTSGNVSSTTQKINVRGRGRSVKLNFLTNVADETNWRLGSMKLQLRPDGRR